jgi:pimeloyl-ACP methyl ester carboxylesterase
MDNNSKKTWRLLIIALVLVLVGSLLAGWIQTGAGAATIREVRFLGMHDGYYSGYLWIPKGVTTGNPAPAVLATHGFNNSKEYMANTALELARRGYVVLSMDLDNHGLSDKSKTPKLPMGEPSMNGIGADDGLKYLRSLDIVDLDNVGMIGMSMGGGAIEAAALHNPDGYSALFFMDSGCGEANCPQLKNFAISVGKHTEVPPNFGAPNGAEIPNMPGAMAAYGIDEPVTPEHLYGSIKEGNGRIFFFHWGDHPISTDDPTSIGNAIRWFGETLDGGKVIPASNQIWPLKLLGTSIAFVGCVIFLMGFGGVLLQNNYFKSLKDEVPEYKGTVGLAWWVFAAITAFLGPITLMPLFMKFFMPNYFKLEPVTSGFVGWLMVIGILTILLLVIGYFTMGKKAGANGVNYAMMWENVGFDWKKIGKSLLLALTVVAAGYLMLFIITALLKVDFRIWVITLKTTDFRHFLVMFAYLIPLAIYFIPLSISLHGTMRPKSGKVSFAQEMIINVAIMLVGYLVLEAWYYIPLTFFGAPSNFGPGGLALINGLALFGLVPAIALVSTYYFRKTGRIYAGAFINILFITWYLVACNTLYSFG